METIKLENVQIQTQTNVSHKHILTDGKYFNKTQTLHAVKMNPATSESVEKTVIIKQISGNNHSAKQLMKWSVYGIILLHCETEQLTINLRAITQFFLYDLMNSLYITEEGKMFSDNFNY